MSGVELCWPSALAAVPAVSAGAGTAANLLTREPKEAWIGDAGAVSIVHDFGSPQAWDTVFLGFTNAAPGTTWSVSYGNAPSGADALALAPAPIIEPLVPPGLAGAYPRVVHLYARLPAAVSRYVKLIVTQPGGAAPLRAGVLIVNAGFRTLWAQELGSGRSVIDTGSRERLIGGGFATSEGVVKAGFQWVFGDLQPDEAEVLHCIARARGEGRPLLAAEDPAMSAGLQERLRYGVFDKLEAWERRDPGKTRWAFSIEDWT